MSKVPKQAGRRSLPSGTDPFRRKGGANTIGKVSGIPPDPRLSQRFSLIRPPPCWFEIGIQRHPAGCDKLQILKDMSRKEKLSDDFFPEGCGSEGASRLRTKIPRAVPELLVGISTRDGNRDSDGGGRSSAPGYRPLNNRGLLAAVLLQTGVRPIRPPFRPDRRTPALLRRCETP